MKKFNDYTIALGPMAITSAYYFAGYPTVAVCVAILLQGLIAGLDVVKGQHREAQNELIEAQRSYIKTFESIKP